jgi:hypothetical protein
MFKRVRSEIAKQANFSVGSATISRIENGATCFEGTAQALCEDIQKTRPDLQFEQLFTLSAVDWYGWSEVNRGATRVGKSIFSRFKADAILTFPGPSQIFTSLAMAKSLSKEQFVCTPVHTAVLSSRKTRSNTLAASGFLEIPTDRYKIFVPGALILGDRKRKRRIAIVDDSVVTGLTMQALKMNLVERYKYHSENIWTACCVCFKDAVYRPDSIAFKAEEKHFHLPWGDSFSFESCFRGTLDHPR